MPVSKSWIWTCDYCGETLRPLSMPGLPLGWVQRFEKRPMGDGPISGYAPRDMADTAVFCCSGHELKWLEAGGHGPVANPLETLKSEDNQEPEPLPPSPPGQPADKVKDKRRKPRWIQKLWADLMGYFWVPCLICGEEFGGHEAAGTWYKTRDSGNVVCANCVEEARKRSEELLEAVGLECGLLPGRMDSPAMAAFRELCAIGNAITVGPYGVFRRQDRFGGITITPEEELEGYLVTERQMYSLQCVLHYAQPYLAGDDKDA